MEYLILLKSFIEAKLIFLKSVITPLSISVFTEFKKHIWPHIYDSFTGTTIFQGIYPQDPILVTVVLCTPFLILGSTNFDTETRISWWGDRFCLFFYCLMMGIFTTGYISHWFLFFELYSP